MHRALWWLALTTSAAAIPSTVWADELQRVGIEGAFFVYSEQEALWIKGTPEAARTSVRLGYGIESQQLNLSFQAGPRFINGVNAVTRTDWSLLLEGAWVPEGTFLEIYGEYAPAWETKAGKEGLQQEAKWGLLIPLTSSSNPTFDIGQGFATASGYYLKVEQEGLWSVGGRQEYLWTRPRLGYGVSAGSLTLDVELGPSFRWSDAQSPHTDAAGLVDVRYSTSQRCELYLQYEPRYRFQAEQPGLVQILRGGLVFSF